jgi:predicted dehydrogenase
VSASPPLRAGVIGCGNVSVRRHIPTLAALPGVELAAVADPVAARRQEALTAGGLSSEAAFKSHQRMLASAQLDYVVVAVTPAIRPAILRDCFRAGLHVLSEKPLALRPSEAQALIRQAETADLRFGMVHNYLFFPEYRAVRQRLEQGAVGKIRHVGLHFMGVPDLPGHADYRPGWRHDIRESGGGVLMDMIHVLYVAEYLVGGPIRAVSALIDNLAYPDGEVEDLALILLYFDEAYVTVNLGWGSGPGGVEVTGTEGRILVFYRDYQTGPFAEVSTLTVVGPQGAERTTPEWTATVPPTFVELHADFVQAIRGGRDPIAPAQAGLRTLEAALGCYASAHTGRVVEIPLDPGAPLYQDGILGLPQLEAWLGSPLQRRGLLGLGRKAKPTT